MQKNKIFPVFDHIRFESLPKLQGHDQPMLRQLHQEVKKLQQEL